MSERLGKYELITKIATGGMAEIHLARAHTAPGVDRVVVIKKLLPQYADRQDFVDMFLDEARVAAALNHPNVVQMFDFGTVTEGSFIAMEYLHGEDVRSLNRTVLGRSDAVPVEHVVHIVANACAGIHHAHEARDFAGNPLHIIHRDVSPHNIVVTFDGATKVLDFGIARAKNRVSRTRHGVLKGKVPYMAPEQLTNSKLDRRTDIYALGVVLFELLTGKRPYKVLKRGEFDLMMAIVKGAVFTPKSLRDDLPDELSAIVMKAMAREPTQRYETAAEMQQALEDYARGAALRLTASSLSQYMRDTFGERVERWRTDKPFTDYVVEREIEKRALRARDEDLVDDSEAGLDEVVPGKETGTSSVADRSDEESDVGVREESASEQTAFGTPHFDTGNELEAIPAPGVELEHYKVGGVDVVLMGGRLTEGFNGTAIGRALHGCVVIDLSKIERITSFGVREWLSMMSEVRSIGTALYLCRVSEAVATQMSMIRSFVGPARLVSFEAPYLCDACGNSFRYLIDCERDAEAIKALSPPRANCPKCSGSSTLDDDPLYLSFAAQHTDLKVPADVRAAIPTGDVAKVAPVESVEKLVTSDTTKLRLRGEIDKTFRWNRALDGTEGKVSVDFEGASLRPEGVTNFVVALRTLPTDVSSVEISACPPEVVIALGPSARSARTRVASVLVGGFCSGCNAARTALVPLDLVLAAEGAAVPCRRCNTPLHSPDVKALRQAFGVSRPPPSLGSHSFPIEGYAAPSLPAGPPSSSRISLEPSPASSSNPRFAPIPPSVVPAPPRPLPVSMAVGLLAAAIVLLLTLTTVLVVRWRTWSGKKTPAPLVSALPATSAPSTPASLPEWVSQPVVRDDESVILLGRSGIAASENDALALAQADAVAAEVNLVLEEMKPSVVKSYILKEGAADGPSTPREISERFLRTNGATSTPERIDTVARRSVSGVEVFGRYRISQRAIAEAAAAYSRTVVVHSVTFARQFPTSRGAATGDVVVVAADKKSGIFVGDVLVRIDDHPVLGADALAPYAQKTKPINMTVVTRGETRRVVVNH